MVVVGMGVGARTEDMGGTTGARMEPLGAAGEGEEGRDVLDLLPRMDSKIPPLWEVRSPLDRGLDVDPPEGRGGVMWTTEERGGGRGGGGDNASRGGSSSSGSGSGGGGFLL